MKMKARLTELGMRLSKSTCLYLKSLIICDVTLFKSIMSGTSNNPTALLYIDYFSLVDKCLAPHYGACPLTRECISSDFMVECGQCLPGFAVNPVNTSGDCLGKFFIAF